MTVVHFGRPACIARCFKSRTAWNTFSCWNSSIESRRHGSGKWSSLRVCCCCQLQRDFHSGWVIWLPSWLPVFQHLQKILPDTLAHWYNLYHSVLVASHEAECLVSTLRFFRTAAITSTSIFSMTSDSSETRNRIFLTPTFLVEDLISQLVPASLYSM